MDIKICFAGPLKKLADCGSITVDLDETENIQSIVTKLAELANANLKDALLDEQRLVQPSILMFRNNELVPRDRNLEIDQSTDFLLTTLISGG